MYRACAGLLAVWALAAAAMPAAGKGFTTLKGHGGPVMGISVDLATGQVGTASFDNSVGLWTGRTPRWLEEHDAAVNTVLSAADDFAAIDWNVATGKTHRLRGHKGKVVGLDLSPDGGWIASASWDGSVGLWPTNGSEAGARFLSDHTAGVNATVFAPDGHGLYSASADGTLRYRPFDPEDGSIMMIDTKSWRITHDFKAMRLGPVWALAFSPDGETVYAWPVDLLDLFEPAGRQASRNFLRAPDAMPNGERQYMRKCSICHALTPAPSRKAGPTLHGILGRSAGAVPGYAYSETLSGSDIVWNEDSIDALFDLGPDDYIPGSKMPQQRITSAADRQDLIAFMRGAPAAKEN